MQLGTIDDQHVRRFAADLARLASDDETVGLAISGGPDSLALLLLAHSARPGRIVAASVDHGLRPEAAGEAAMVGEQCAALGVPHQILTLDWPDGKPTANVQAVARERRYTALFDWATAGGFSVIATAHHADDQAETLLMRLARGAGIGGLAGARPTRHIRADLRVIRPLLLWRKAELEALVAAAGLDAVDDPTNSDPAHDRSRVRAALAGSGFDDALGYALSAMHLADAEEALLFSLADLAPKRLRQDGEAWTLDPKGLPIEYLRRLVVLALARCGEEAPRGPQLTQAIASLLQGEQAMLGNVLIAENGGIWRFAPAPPRRSL